MIGRYSRPEMSRIWSEQNCFQKWLEIEILAAEALTQLGEVPKGAVQRIKKKARFDIARIREIEKEVRHDLIAFLSCLAESLGDDARFIHLGMTSSDVLDTALALQLKEASALLSKDVRKLMVVLRRQAVKYKKVPMIGRTHGIHAEPITFGLKLALWYDEMGRNLSRLEKAAEEVSVGKISGAVGTFAQISPEVEAYVCNKCGLKPAPVSNQIVQRDRHAFFFATLAVIASSLEKFATEIRHLQRTEVLEAEEPFVKGQKGSSLENVSLWHERDISHSSVERVIAPDATILLDFMLSRMTYILTGLCVYPQAMKRNLEKSGGAIFSQGLLLRLVDKGLSRDAAYRLVQRHALKAGRSSKDFKRELLKDLKLRKYVSPNEIEKIWDLKYYFKHVDFIFRRVFTNL
jgi:adenylosuccinate lyase